jgi:hypothetical protein
MRREQIVCPFVFFRAGVSLLSESPFDCSTEREEKRKIF